MCTAYVSVSVDLPAEKEENEVASAEASSYAAPIVDSIHPENNQESDHEGDRSQEKEDHRDVEEEIRVANEVNNAIEEQHVAALSTAEVGREIEEKSEGIYDHLHDARKLFQGWLAAACMITIAPAQ